MSGLFITGLGAVSPAGWGVGPFCDVLEKGEPLPVQPLDRPGWSKPLRIRLVPAPLDRPACFGHARLRRASPLTQYAAAASLEALGQLSPDQRQSPVGMIFCLQIGPVQYASRFFQEVINDPATSSPLLFPETVLSAPASHVAALIGNMPLVYTIIGDPAVFLEGVAMAADWLEEGRVEQCLVVGAEEFNWLQADAARHFDSNAIFAPGAAAVCLSREAGAPAVEIRTITSPQPYTAGQSLGAAAKRMRSELPAGSGEELLCDGLGGAPRPCLAEREAWRDWPGVRCSPKQVFGEGLMAAAGWQVVAAAAGISSRRYRAAVVSLVGCNQQAIGARLVAC